jgi:hypothetical protein
MENSILPGGTEKNGPLAISRREACRRALVFSAALLIPEWPGFRLRASEPGPQGLDFFCFGDWGAGSGPNQAAVAAALQAYARDTLKAPPHAFLLLGDNFYGPLPGVDSPRWEGEFESMYPAEHFPGPCYAILGNHDYDDQPGGERIQLDYGQTRQTRWTMPDRWYRLDLPAERPVVTLLCTDTHFKKLSPGDIAAQQSWLEAELAKPRTAPWLMVCGHHPVMSCGPHHGDSTYLAPWKELFYRHGVDAYLCGHEHDLQHLREEGKPTDWLVSGGGGRPLHPVGEKNGVQFAQERFGFLHLAVRDASWTAAFVGTEAGVLHQMERRKS